MNTEQEFELQKSKISNEELIELAYKEIGELAKSYGKSHKMSIPPRITDTDMLLTEVVKRFEVATSQTEALKKEIEGLIEQKCKQQDAILQWFKDEYDSSIPEDKVDEMDKASHGYGEQIKVLKYLVSKITPPKQL